MSGVSLSLEQLLKLVGELNDQPGNDTPRDRFRQFLKTSVTSLGTVRDYVNTCLNSTGTQYNRALQDLVNHTGHLMGFDVEFGRYAGVTNDIGHDGLWRADNFSVVVEVKTTDAYSIMTSTLLGYINQLIDSGRIANSENAIGLYVFGKQSSELEPLEGAIIHGGHAQKLRLSTIDDILSLAELVQDELLTRDEAMTLLRPVGVRVGTTVQLLKRVATASPFPRDDVEPETYAATAPRPMLIQEEKTPRKQARSLSSVATESQYLMTPVSDDKDSTAEETIRALLDHGEYVFGDRTPGRKKLKPGDQLAFYESGKGVVACAEVASSPELRKVAHVRHAEKYPWAFKVRNVRYFFDRPVAIDSEIRAKLEAFRGRELQRSWSWFVQGTRKLTQHDFEVLTSDGA